MNQDVHYTRAFFGVKAEIHRIFMALRSPGIAWGKLTASKDPQLLIAARPPSSSGSVAANRRPNPPRPRLPALGPVAAAPAYTPPMSDSPVALVWFRQDLRLDDNPALQAAVDLAAQVVPLFIFTPHEEDSWPPGGASRWWLHHALAALDRELRSRQSRLIIRTGDSLATLHRVAKQTGATHVFWNRRYEPHAIERDARIKSALRHDRLSVSSFNGSLLYEPGRILSRSGDPLKVYTPFWRACEREGEPDSPRPLSGRLSHPSDWPESMGLASLSLLPKVRWDEGLGETWTPGEAGASRQLERFLSEGASQYAEARDRPDVAGTSRLSPHLHHGEISPRRIWAAVRGASEDGRRSLVAPAARKFLQELVWREFSYHVLFHFPHLPTEPLQEKFRDFPWRDDEADWKAWRSGKTGYPIVDAGMRELWRTGWMHNRVRMIVASFLVKDLRLHWLAGARWFWDTLVDADLANNTQGWQWAAGCGTDAAPYFRIFNPTRQGRRFDPEGAYVRLWVPELAELEHDYLHAPWDAPAAALDQAGVRLGETYPHPIVDHAEARRAALDAFAVISDPN